VPIYSALPPQQAVRGFAFPRTLFSAVLTAASIQLQPLVSIYDVVCRGFWLAWSPALHDLHAIAEQSVHLPGPGLFVLRATATLRDCPRFSTEAMGGNALNFVFLLDAWFDSQQLLHRLPKRLPLPRFIRSLGISAASEFTCKPRQLQEWQV
jgi:hypothetical protein